MSKPLKILLLVVLAAGVILWLKPGDNKSGSSADPSKNESPATGSSSSTITDNPAGSEKDDTYYFVSITKIANRTLEQVEKYLGKPISHEVIHPAGASCPCEQYLYWNGNVQVVFIKGKADWITVHNLRSHPFTPGEALSAIGIPNSFRPDISTDDLLEWKLLNGYRSVQIFSDGHHKIDRAYIQANTLQ